MISEPLAHARGAEPNLEWLPNRSLTRAAPNRTSN